MNIQIFGTKSAMIQRKQNAFFKERGIKYQFIDMKEKGMSKASLTPLPRQTEAWKNMINWDGKDKDILSLIKYIAEEDKLQKSWKIPR